MTCWWIGCNHVSDGLVKINPSKRLVLELVSFILLLITWCFTIPGIVLLLDQNLGALLLEGKIHFGQLFQLLKLLVGGESTKEEDEMANIIGDADEESISIFKATGNSIFVPFSIVYTVWTAILLGLNLFYRREYLTCGERPEPKSSEWADRKDRDNCCKICSPFNALRMFHHMEHRAAFIVYLVCVIMGVDLYFSIPLLLLTFAQTIISYLYAEDIVLCGLPLCCVQLFFIRRYPKEEQGVLRV